MKSVNIDGGDTKEFYDKAGYFPRSRDMEQLFDTYLDPGECRNLAEDSAYRHILEDMRLRLAEHQKRYSDPLLSLTSGHLPAQPDASVVY